MDDMHREKLKIIARMLHHVRAMRQSVLDTAGTPSCFLFGFNSPFDAVVQCSKAEDHYLQVAAKYAAMT